MQDNNDHNQNPQPANADNNAVESSTVADTGSAPTEAEQATLETGKQTFKFSGDGGDYFGEEKGNRGKKPGGGECC